MRKVGAWVGEKLSRAKLSLEDKGVGFVQALESFVLGIKGKELLWRVLQSLKYSPELKRFDLHRLLERARLAHGREAHRSRRLCICRAVI